MNDIENGEKFAIWHNSIGGMVDETCKTPFYTKFFWNILSELQSEIKKRLDKGYIDLQVNFPERESFYNDSDPLGLFNQVFHQYKINADNDSKWKKLKFIFMLDEFTGIYEQITKGLIPASFMKNLKAFLEKDYFRVVLAGNDIMPKFMEKFANEFAFMYPERIAYISKEEAKKLIDNPIKIGGENGESRYKENAIEEVLKWTACSPYYIQWFCKRLVDYMNKNKAKFVTPADIDNVKNEMMPELFIEDFHNLLDPGIGLNLCGEMLKVLKEIALRSKNEACQRKSILCQTNTPLIEILGDLVRRDVLKKERGEHYKICVGLFSEWLRNTVE